ncbi:MAG: VCBS repeat-containing protein [Solirubrobacteraceae bacterium]|nr:VCBS repeat-containing protein [Solirubrobacteraceae bacterium]
MVPTSSGLLRAALIALLAATAGAAATAPAHAGPISFANAKTSWTGGLGGPGVHENSSSAADFDNDGDPDVVTANYFTGVGPTVMTNRGDGTFRTPGRVLPVGLLVGTVITGDVNEDGNQDIVATNFVKAVVLLGRGDGTFRTGDTYLVVQGGQEDAALHDLDGDGHLDLTILTRYGVSVQMGRGDGGFGSPRITIIGPANLPSPLMSGFAIADIDGDATPDLYAADAGLQTVYAMRGDGDGTFTQRGTGTTVLVPGTMLATDLDNDGIDDAVVLNEFNVPGHNTAVLLANGSGGLGSARSYASGLIPATGEVGDFDEDGNNDVVSSDTVGSQIVVLQGDGTGKLTKAVGKSVSLFQQTPVVADFDGDGRQDIGAAGSSTGLALGLTGLSILRNTSP